MYPLFSLLKSTYKVLGKIQSILELSFRRIVFIPVSQIIQWRPLELKQIMLGNPTGLFNLDFLTAWPFPKAFPSRRALLGQPGGHLVAAVSRETDDMY